MATKKKVESRKVDSSFKEVILNENSDERIPTNIVALDSLIGGGLPKGGVVMIYSDKAGYGKTTMMLQIAKSLIESGKRVAYVDSENAARSICIKMGLSGYTQDGLLRWYEHNTLSTLEDYFIKIVDDPDIRPDVVIIDSVAMFIADPDKKAEDVHYSPESKIWTRMISKYKALFFEHGISVIMTNQTRANISGGGSFKRASNPAGGSWTDFVPDIKIRARKGGATIEAPVMSASTGGKVVSPNVYLLNLSCEKNKYGTDGVEIEAPFVKTKGLSNYLYLSRLLLQNKYFTKVGSRKTSTEYTAMKKFPYELEVIKGSANFFQYVKDNFSEIYLLLQRNGDLNLVKEDEVIEDSDGSED